MKMKLALSLCVLTFSALSAYADSSSTAVCDLSINHGGKSMQECGTLTVDLSQDGIDNKSTFRACPNVGISLSHFNAQGIDLEVGFVTSVNGVAFNTNQSSTATVDGPMPSRVMVNYSYTEKSGFLGTTQEQDNLLVVCTRQ